MPPRHRYHEPLIETEPLPTTVIELPPMPGLLVEKPGAYLHVETVAYVIRTVADRVRAEHPAASAALDGLAESFAAVGQEEPEPDPEPLVPGRVEDPDPAANVARVEVFPDAEGKWYARSVDAEGAILDTRNGSFDKQYVIRAASERWPGKEIHELPDAQMDSIWEEQHHAFGWNGRRRPSPRRLWG